MQLGRTTGWVALVLRAAWGMYCAFGSQAAPRLPQPALTSHQGVHFPRAVQRMLVRRGVIGASLHSRLTVARQAHEALVDLWQSLGGTSAVLWMDNFYRRRFVVNPAVGYSSTACTILSFLTGLPTIAQGPRLTSVVALDHKYLFVQERLPTFFWSYDE